MSYWFWTACDTYYSKAKDRYLYHTEEDKVTVVLTKEQLKTK